MAGDQRIAPSIQSLVDGNGIEIVDSVERRRFRLHTSEPVCPTSGDSVSFPAPVDVSAEFVTREIVLQELVDAIVRPPRAGDGVRIQPGDTLEVDEGRCYVELTGPIKVYLAVSGPVSVSAGVDRLTFEFDEQRVVRVGARSYHERPVATLTTTTDPGDLMTALSYLGSALKTTGPDRSYPTLRGHPPEISLGDGLRIPPGLDRPETHVTLELPPDLSSAFVAAPLAYYLGADLEPADRARIVTDDGFVRSLEAGNGFQTTVERVLKQVFLLDCVTRTEGHDGVVLHEREALEPLVDLDFGSLYDDSLQGRVAAYLDVPFDVVEPHVPSWPLTAHLPPEPEQVEAIPYVVNDLAIVRSGTPRTLSSEEIRTAVLRRHLDEDRSRDVTGSGGRLRCGNDQPETVDVVELEETDSLDDAWLGDAVPLQATKANATAFRNRLDHDPNDGPIEVTVVCNDRGESDEDVVTDVYGSGNEIPFDVTLRRDLSTAELRTVLASERDFLHYVGHIDDEGFRCRDGVLDAATLDDVGVVTFFLNACRSYRQGLSLIDGGSVGGVVTIGDVIDSGAVRVGRAMARLLDVGYPLHAALSVARSESVVGGHYVVVGDGRADVVSAKNVVPVLCDVSRAGDDAYDLRLRVFVPKGGGVGGVFAPTLPGMDRHYLIPGDIGPFRVSESTLREYLAGHPYPVRTSDGMVWNDASGGIDL